MTDKPFQLLHRTFHDTVLQTQSTVQRCSFLDYHGQPTTHPLLYKLQGQSDRALFHPDRFQRFLTNLLRLIFTCIIYFDF